MKSIKNNKAVGYVAAGLGSGAVTCFLSLIIYGLIQQQYSLGKISIPLYFLSGIANGFLITSVLSWGKFRHIKQGAIVGALTAGLTDAYFVFVALAMFGSTSIGGEPTSVWQGLLKVLIWAIQNAFVGMVSAYILRKINGPSEQRLITGRSIKKYIGASVLGGILTILLTVILYAVILAPFLLGNESGTTSTDLMINMNIALFLIANISHGAIICAVIRWGGFYRFWQGTMVATTFAGLTDIYAGLRDAAMVISGGMTVASALQDTIIWMVLNVFLGALLSVWLKWRDISSVAT